MFLPDLPCNIKVFSAGTIISFIQTEICLTIFDLFSENKKQSACQRNIFHYYKKRAIITYKFELSSFEDYFFITFSCKKTANFLPQLLSENFIATLYAKSNALNIFLP